MYELYDIATVVKAQVHLAMRWPRITEVVDLPRARLLTLALDLLMSHAIAFERFELKSLALLLLLVRASPVSYTHLTLPTSNSV